MMSHRNLLANFEQLMAIYFADCGKVAPPDGTLVSWLPFYHDMVCFSEFARRFWRGFPLRSRARWLFCSGRPGGCNCWQAIVTHSQQHRTLLLN
jgi:hypothetical protein